MSAPTPAAVPAAHPVQSGFALKATIFLLAAIEYLQSGMTAFGAAPIMGETSLSPEDFSLIAAAYAAVAIVMISMQRWIVARIGGRLFVQVSASVSALGAVLCANSGDFNSFLAGRVVMALGGGVFLTSARMMIQHRLAGPARFGGIVFLASGLATGIALSPWLASVAVSQGTWSAMFWGLAGLDVLVVLLAQVSLSPQPLGTGRTAEPGVLDQTLLVIGSFLLLYSLQRFYYDFYGNVALAALSLAIAVLGLVLYLRRQHHKARPLLRVRELLHAQEAGGGLRVRYLTGLAVFAVTYCMLGANNYVIPLMMQRTLGYTWETVGHFQTIGLLVALLTWGVMSRLLPRWPAPRKFYTVGFGALALFAFLLTRITSEANLWSNVLPALALNSVFLLTVMPTTAMHTFRGMEDDEELFSNAQQLKNMMAQAGIALGITLATLGQQWRTAVHYGVLDAQIHPGNPAFNAIAGQLQQQLATTVGPEQAAHIATAQVAQLLNQQAAMLANIDHFAAIAVVGALGVVAMLTQKVLR
jgi:DHA2 family multidrug resistance protein